MEGTSVIERVARDDRERIPAPSSIESDAHMLASSSITRMAEYDSTLYFLDDREIDYLQSEIRADFSSDLRERVIASLLDTYEQQADAAVREEVAGILDSLFLLLLSLTQFRTAAFLIREATVTVGRSRDLSLVERHRLVELSDRLSEKDIFEQLLHALEDTVLRAPQDDLQELFSQFKPVALETLLSWIGRSRNVDLRLLLETAGSRLASAHTAELVRLISSPDQVVAFEAVRRAGAMKSTAAVAALAGVIAHGSSELRLAGVAALSDIGSPGALQVLERALEDEDRDIRVATVRMLGSRNHRAALSGIENHIRTPTLRSGTLAEKMAFFEGRAPSIKKIKRVVQGIVDQILNEETSLVGLTAIRDYDEYTFTHSVNACIFAVALGRRLGMTKNQLFDLGLSALMHDIGKSRVPIDCLNRVTSCSISNGGR
ncbi:MAG: HEAT repeat domain-containing protein [Gemmatimonadota bacterium]|nr:HEAT repeat domain-containing protein [Gemmatimonadota bacterium]